MDSAISKITMVPLQVTHSAIMTDAVRDRLYAAAARRGGAYRECISGMLDFFRESYATHFGFEDGPPIHDPCAVAYVMCPSMFETRRLRIEIETRSELLAGMTVVDTRSELPANCDVAVRMNVGKFWTMMIDAVGGGGGT